MGYFPKEYPARLGLPARTLSLAAQNPRALRDSFISAVSKMQTADLLLPRSSARIFIAGSPVQKGPWAIHEMSPHKVWDYDPVNDLRPGDPAYIASTKLSRSVALWQSARREDTVKRRLGGLIGLILWAVVVYFVWTHLSGGVGLKRNLARNTLLGGLTPAGIYCLVVLFGNPKKEHKP